MLDLIHAIPVIGPLLTFVIPFVIVLGVVVTVHEYGHYIVGRWCGIKAEVFSVGYGKPIWSRPDRHGTIWQVAWLPLGGYVKFLGDADGSSRTDYEALSELSEEERDASFPGATVGRRALTVLAGPVFNFILSAFVFAGLALYQGQVAEQPTVAKLNVPLGEGQDLRAGDQILKIDGRDTGSFEALYKALDAMSPKGPASMLVRRDGQDVEIVGPYLLPPLVSGVQPLSPASNACVEQGDLILSVDGKPLGSFSDLKDIVLASEAQELSMQILRGEDEKTLLITPQVTDFMTADGSFEKRVMIGVQGDLAFEVATENRGIFNALQFGVEQVYSVITTSLNGLKHILFGSLSATNLQGPLGIAQVSGEVASQGFLSLIQWIALISTAIGLLNLFPIPVLDGGHLVVFAVEAATGKPPAERVMQVAMALGLSMLLMLMLFTTYNDGWRIVNQPTAIC